MTNMSCKYDLSMHASKVILIVHIFFTSACDGEVHKTG